MSSRMKLDRKMPNPACLDAIVAVSMSLATRPAVPVALRVERMSEDAPIRFTNPTNAATAEAKNRNSRNAMALPSTVAKASRSRS